MKPADETLGLLREVVTTARSVLSPAIFDDSLEQSIRSLTVVDESAELAPSVGITEKLAIEVETCCGAEARGLFLTAVVATLALRLPDRMPTMNLPRSVLDAFPAAMVRLANHVTDAELASYRCDDDLFLKDLHIAGGFSVPGGALDIDLYGTISRLSGVKAMLAGREFRSGLRIMRIGGPVWFKIHVDSRYLDAFNEMGWATVYLRAADLLPERPAVKGMVGTSWFYDPALLEISPKLAYLQTTPASGGAFFVRHGSSPFDFDLATARSPTRRALAEKGEYLPTCYSLVWPREALLAWAQRVRRE